MSQAEYAMSVFNLFQMEIVVAVCVPQSTQNLVILRSCFAEDDTKIYNAHAQLLNCSFNFLFGDVHVTLVVVA